MPIRQKGADMPEENANVVDSTEAGAEVDSSAELEAKAPAETASKTFTVEEVDAVIKKRIDKQNAKHKSETDELSGRISDLEKLLKEKTDEAEKLKAATHRAEWAKAAHEKHKSVPEDVLTHEALNFSAPEEVEAFAAFLAEKLDAPSVFKPIRRDTGDPKSPKPDAETAFIKNLFDRKD